jgi:hypothetical protein
MWRRKLPLFFLAGLSLVLLAQCGLERPLKPWDAPIPVTGISSYFVFTTGSDNHDTADRQFKGYEVYYKLAINSIDFHDHNDDSLTDPSQLTANGFNRLYSSNDTWQPPNTAYPPLLVTVDALEPFGPYNITLDFNGIIPYDPNNPTPEATATSGSGLIVGEPLNLRRAVHSQAPTIGSIDYGHYKRFNAFYYTDPDAPSGALDVSDYNGKQLSFWIYIYVYATGYNYNDLSREIKSPLCNLSCKSFTFYYSNEQS